MSSNIQISTPFLRSYSHFNTTVGTSLVKVLDYVDIPKKRVSLVVQNQSTGNQNIYIVLNSTDADGIIIPPLSSYSFDNYNGQIYAKGSAANAIVHIAESVV